MIINIHSYTKGGSQVFDRCELQKILGISNRGVWRKHLIACGYNPNDLEARYSWSDVPILKALQLFLQAKRGRHRHQYTDFDNLRENNQLSDELIQKAKELTEEIKHGYNKS